MRHIFRAKVSDTKCMHILMISDVYFPRINGVSTSIQSFRTELITLGHRVTLIAPDYGELTQDEQDIIRIPSRVVIVDKEDRMMKRSILRKIVNGLDLNQFDIIHIQTPFIAHYEGIRIAKLSNKKVVSTYHTFFEEYLYLYIKWLPRGLMRFLARSFTRKQCKQYNALIVPSTPMHKVLLEYGIDTESHIIPTGIQSHYYEQGDTTAFKLKHNIPESVPMLLYVGRVAFEKNIEFLLQVANELKNRNLKFTLVIAGEGPAEDEIKKKSKKLGINHNTRFLGNMDRDTELQTCYQAADLFVFASKTETQGLVLLEAMAQGTPVVSTTAMGTIEVMGDNRGGLIADENIQDFTDKTICLLSDRELYAECKADALAYVEEWSEKTMAKRLLSVYENVTGNQSN